MNDDNDTRQGVLGYFQMKGSIPGASEQDRLGYDYLDSGFLDSVGIVEMVAHLEQKFAVRFGPEHMQSEDFRSVGGLIRIIERLRR